MIPILLVAFLLLPVQAFSLAGDASDPLVSKSWVDAFVEETVSALEAQARELLVEAKKLQHKDIVLSLDSNIAYINQKPIQMDVRPKVVQVEGGGVTLVPLRFVGEALKVSVNWDAQSKTVICRDDSTKIELPLGSSTATVNGEQLRLQASVMAENGRTLVPLRFISQAFNCSVEWDGKAQKITIRNY